MNYPLANPIGKIAAGRLPDLSDLENLPSFHAHPLLPPSLFMKCSFIVCHCVALLLIASISRGAEQLTYRGSFAPVKIESGEDARKTFEIQLIQSDGDGEQIQAWVLSETGRGAWPWTDRFGVSKAGADSNPALLYDRGDGYAVVPLPSLRHVADQPLAKDASWKANGLTYRVVDEGRIAGIDAWQVVGSNDYGPRRTLWIAQDAPLVVGFDDKVFIGQGVECRLSCELVERKVINADAAKSMLSGFTSLDELRGKLGWKPQTRELKWNAEQLPVLREQLPAITKSITTGPLVALAQIAEKDAQTQDSRRDALAALKQKALGKTVENFALAGIGGEKLSPEDFAKQVTVLHFWDYKDAPLEEPYGQVGYLDFLARQKAKSGVKVYGVVVDERLTDRSTRGQALSSARKVKEFMNLSYGILFDEDALLKKIGDPRTTGAKLPLWVVIGKDGKVAHYHVGFYDVLRDQGLAELDKAIGEATK